MIQILGSLMKHLLKKILFFILFLTPFQILFADPYIVVLKGTSRSGKSSICKELQREDSSWYAVEEDVYLFENYLKILSFYYPEESSVILQAVGDENFAHAVVRGQICFKEAISESDKEKALASIAYIQERLNNTDIANEIMRHSKKDLVWDVSEALKEGKNVIIDTPSPGLITAKAAKSLFPGYSIVSALVYCSLPQTLKHLEDRNRYAEEVGDFSLKRYYRQVLIQFHNLFAITLMPKNALFSEDTFVFHQTFEDLQKKVIPSWDVQDITKFPRQEMNLLSLSEMEDKMFHYFPGLEKKTLYIAPREKYDVIINSVEGTPCESAAKLTAYLYGDQK